MTQTQVAKRLNLSKSAISGYENNIKTPSLEVLKEMCKLYGVTSDYLLGLDHRRVIYTDRLSERQEEILNNILEEFRKTVERDYYKK